MLTVFGRQIGELPGILGGIPEKSNPLKIAVRIHDVTLLDAAVESLIHSFRVLIPALTQLVRCLIFTDQRIHCFIKNASTQTVKCTRPGAKCVFLCSLNPFPLN